MGMDDVQSDIRREVLATLKANRAATLETVLGNWRYHRHGVLDDAEAALVETILRDERTALTHRELNRDDTAWWRRVLR
jgi:hypothetical protein